MSPVVKLHLAQLGCIVSVLAGVALAYWRHNPDEVPLTTRHWIVMVAAVWSAVSGFTLQRRIVNRRPSRSGRSTPFTRCRSGNIARLWTATSLGPWARCAQRLGWSASSRQCLLCNRAHLVVVLVAECGSWASL